MSDNVPFHIQEEIIKRLPAKPLLQFRSVSKAWKSLIDSSEFIATHCVRHSQQQHLLVRYHDKLGTGRKCVSFVDDDTFPQQIFIPTLPPSIKLLRFPMTVGCSQGLLCLCGYYLKPENSYTNSATEAIVLWNPSIGKSIAINVPDVLNRGEEMVLGFGVCPVTNVPKIVKFTQSLSSSFERETETSHHCNVKVYTLSSRKWRSLSCMLSKSILVKWCQVVVDRFIYWCAFSRKALENGFKTSKSNMILSLDLTNENFKVLNLPNSLECHPDNELSISKLRDSLVVLQYDINNKKRVCDVWMMNHGVERSFTKLFSVHAQAPCQVMSTLGFRKNGQAIIEVVSDYENILDPRTALAIYDANKAPCWSIKTLNGQPIIEVENEYENILEWPTALAIYDPNTEHIKHFGICGSNDPFFVHTYTETLMLLDISDYSSS